ncbi:eukaryotic translation initiation factor 2 subunit beta isoform X2 [Arctopsyche grandis]|uniref:eukaryotic translation initiation factor 2 subunit beta isoform X2 n=1 Tax=Arctopsyche grandis TaxID=121162 RepID=UPI00406D666D
MDDTPMFDPTKKKKKKKTPFDIEAALASADAAAPAAPSDPASAEAAVPDDDGNGKDKDLDLYGKTKKKKKKTFFNTEESESAVPDLRDDRPSLDDLDHKEEDVEDDLDLDIDFSKTKKKKKKKNLDDFIAEDEQNKSENKENIEDTGNLWVGSDRDYTYDELLDRVFDIMREKNPAMVSGKKQKFVMRPPQVVRIGTKKTSFANFTEICKTLHRQPKHLLDFLLAELGTSGSVDGNSQLIIKGRFQQKQIENVLRRYIKEYVTCHTCRSPETILQKDTRLFFLQCETCGSRCSVASIKSGFQAVTGKRAAIRAKTA